MNVIILCQGQQRRLPELTHSKHMLLVDDEPILARTLRILSKAIGGPSQCPVVVFGAPDLMPALVAGQANGLRTPLLAQIPEPGICVVDGIHAVQAAWNERGRTLVLLGDVVWSWDALGSLLADRRPLVFAGTPNVNNSGGEMFGFAFDDAVQMAELCATCPCRRVNFSVTQGGHLRRLLWHAQKSLGLEPLVNQTWHPDLFLPILDWTDDIDTPADVARLPELGQLARDEFHIKGWVYFDRDGKPHDVIP